MTKLRPLTIALGLALLTFSISAFAQQNCHDFRAVYHQTLWVDLGSNVGDWFTDPDPIRGLWDLRPVVPTVQYIPGTQTGGAGVAGRYFDFKKVWDFGGGDTFTVGNYHAIFPTPPGNAGMGTFTATGKIVAGTGKFEGATGTEWESGPYLMWVAEDEVVAPPCQADAPCLTGKYNAAVSIRVCMR